MPPARPTTTRASVLSRGRDSVFEEGVRYYLAMHLPCTCKNRSVSVSGDTTGLGLGLGTVPVGASAVSGAVLTCFSARSCFLSFSLRPSLGEVVHSAPEP